MKLLCGKKVNIPNLKSGYEKEVETLTVEATKLEEKIKRLQEEI